MRENPTRLNLFADAINRAFSKQSAGYDEADKNNTILQDLRQQVYQHVGRYLKPPAHILELNSGTGIDAVYFASQGHYVHATDLSDGMIHQIQNKITADDYQNRLSCQQISFADLDNLSEKKFNYIFSNFGGLNCIQDLGAVARSLPALLKPGGYVTWVIMPPMCPWEWMWAIKGKWKQAFRRLSKHGVIAHVEGEYFRTYYHSLKDIRLALGDSFDLIESEGLAALSPPPYRHDFPAKHPGIYRFLRKLDQYLGKTFPFNRWADHLIVTFRYSAR